MTDVKNHPLFSEFDKNKPENIKQEPQEPQDENLSQRFERERLEWTEKITALSKMLKSIDETAELQTEVYSQRQIAVEYYHYIMTLLANKNREYRKKYKERFEFYSNSYDYRVKDEIKSTFIANDLSEIYSIKESLENHMKFMDKTIGTIDNIIFGIKHRISLEEYKRRL
jgi:hypothetical protein